ncbi:MAG: hypothetical protein IT161_17345 [Bryobacterales bacterium]|nr:hypothetical protein [Bryobacterales bacterium]
MLSAPVLLLLLQSPEAAGSIMAKVAANQDKAQSARSRFVYKQEVYTRILRTNNKLAREEKREYTVTPTPDGTRKELVKFAGKYEHKGKIVEYDDPGHKHKDTDIDGDVIEDLTDDFVNDKQSKDGVTMDLFPLTRDKQADYTFELEGTKEIKGRKVYRISFKPADKEDFGWTGEVLVDAEEYQPVNVFTKMSRGVPWGVKVFLGTDVKQLGFNLTYTRVAEGIWFPATYGTEFRIDVLWGYKRVITLAMTNSDFRRADVESTIEYKSSQN